jgi:hypothetical protein
MIYKGYLWWMRTFITMAENRRDWWSQWYKTGRPHKPVKILQWNLAVIPSSITKDINPNDGGGDKSPKLWFTIPLSQDFTAFGHCESFKTYTARILFHLLQPINVVLKSSWLETRTKANYTTTNILLYLLHLLVLKTIFYSKLLYTLILFIIEDKNTLKDNFWSEDL